MSFNSDTKKEITTLAVGKKCCQLAQISGILRFAGSIVKSEDKLGLRITTDNPALARLYLTLIKDYFGSKSALQVLEPQRLKSRTYELIITPEMNAEAILRETEMLGIKEGFNYLTDGISPALTKRRCCKKACLRGVFLAAGSITDPAKGNHLEIKCSSSICANDVLRLINSFGLRSKIARRGNKHIVYIKDGEQILDFLSLMGVSVQLFKMQNIRITKEMRNTANRQTNCDMANIGRSDAAAERQLAEINYIAETKGLDYLPARLKSTAQMRIDHPNTNLSDLAAMFDPPISKAGLNHRFKKISQLAQNIKANRIQ